VYRLQLLRFIINLHCSRLQFDGFCFMVTDCC